MIKSELPNISIVIVQNHWNIRRVCTRGLHYQRVQVGTLVFPCISKFSLAQPTGAMHLQQSLVLAAYSYKSTNQLSAYIYNNNNDNNNNGNHLLMGSKLHFRPGNLIDAGCNCGCPPTDSQQDYHIVIEVRGWLRCLWGRLRCLRRTAD